MMITVISSVSVSTLKGAPASSFSLLIYKTLGNYNHTLFTLNSQHLSS